MGKKEFILMEELLEQWKKYLNEEHFFEEYKQYLPKKIREKIGFKLKSQGSFGTVFEFDDDKIIKFEVLKYALRRQERLDKYLSFLGHFTDKNYKNVARIVDFGVEAIPDKNQFFAKAIIYTVMEKLFPLDLVFYQILSYYEFRESGTSESALGEASILLKDLKMYEKYENSNKIPNDPELAYKFKLFGKILEPGRRKLKEFGEFLSYLSKSDLAHYDLHKGNILQDKDGNLKAIDHGGFLQELGLTLG